MKNRIFACTGFVSLVLAAISCSSSSRRARPIIIPPQNQPPIISGRVNQWSTNWTWLFDTQTLSNWAITDFGGHGPITVAAGEINIGMGDDLSGITWTNGTLPLTNYEIRLEAEKVDGSDFFCGLTFPVADSSCSLIIGGWGGAVIGLSSIDGNDASENETTTTKTLVRGHWYQVQLRVTADRIQAWIDGEKIIDLATAGKKISLRPGPIFLSAPLGIATYQTTAAIRNIHLRRIEYRTPPNP